MRALFFPQNGTHLDNMVPIAEILHDHGIEVVFFDSRKIYGQDLAYNCNFVTKYPVIDNSFKDSFYKLNFFEKIRFILFHKKQFIELAKKFDLFVFGNDGAIQRIFINHARRHGKKSFIILDGIISNYSYSLFDILVNDIKGINKHLFPWVKSTLKRSIYKIARKTPLNIYFPSVVGCSHVDAVFLIGEHSRKALYEICGQDNSYSFGLPYMSRLFRIDDTHHYQSVKKHDEKKIVFLTSAYKWHNLFDLDLAQHEDIALLCKTISKLNSKKKNNIRLHIKLHPREDEQSYLKYISYSFVEIIKHGEIEDIVSDADIVFSNLSTAILESILLKKPTYSLMINFPYWRFKNSFISNDAIFKIFNEEQLEKKIQKYTGDKTEDEVDIPNEIYTLISLDTEKSAELISKKIIDMIFNG